MLSLVFLPALSQVMGNRRSDEPAKTKKGLSSILDAARWNRGEPQGKAALDSALPCLPQLLPLTVSFSLISVPDFRHLKAEVDGNGPAAIASILGACVGEAGTWTPGSEGGGDGGQTPRSP